jgi:hypothetical protein
MTRAERKEIKRRYVKYIRRDVPRIHHVINERAAIAEEMRIAQGRLMRRLRADADELEHRVKHPRENLWPNYDEIGLEAA